MTIEERIKEIQGRVNLRKEYGVSTNSDEDITFLLSELKMCREGLRSFGCQNPIGHEVEYVSEDMAIDAGDRSLAGSVFREASWEECGACVVCQALHPEGVK